MSGWRKGRHGTIRVNQTQYPHPHWACCLCYHSQITPSLLSSFPLFFSRSFRAQHTNEQGTAPLHSSFQGVVTFFSSPHLYTVLPWAALSRPAAHPVFFSVTHPFSVHSHLSSLSQLVTVIEMLQSDLFVIIGQGKTKTR